MWHFVLDSMKKILLLIFLSSCAFSQRKLVIPSIKMGDLNEKYSFCELKDERTYKSTIGFCLDSASKKESILVSNGLKQALKNALRVRSSADSLKSKILIRIKSFEFSEKLNENYQISGKFIIKLDFENVKSTDTTYLITYNNSVSFTRSFTKNGTKNYEAIMQSQLQNAVKYFDNWFQKNHSLHEAFIRKTEITILPDLKTDDADTLMYGVREVTWDDFKGKAKFTGNFAGAIFPNIGYTAEYKIESNILKAKIQANAYMVKGMSWIRSDNKTENALKHENFHFAIAKIIIERFKTKVADFQANTIADLQSMIQLQYLDSYREMNKLQEQYDGETQHGLNTTKQAEWEQKIKNWLK